MAVLDDLIYQKEPLQKILVTLYNHFKKLYFCKIAVEINKDVVSALNLKPNQTFLVRILPLNKPLHFLKLLDKQRFYPLLLPQKQDAPFLLLYRYFLVNTIKI